ncbi:MAG: YdbH domain-containing protein [Novosphingobium sp.]
MSASPRRWWWRRAVIGVVAVLAFAFILTWFSRDQIAENLVSGQIDRLGLRATYEIESIGTDEQVLRHIVIGDPARPDLTIDRARVRLLPRWGLPALGRITLERARLYGSYRGGKLSFGSLDKVLFTGSKEPFRLPDLDLKLVDARALLESDYGPVGMKLEGSGALRDGFSGLLAVIAPQPAKGDCAAQRASLYGKLTVTAEKPHFVGPLRLASLACPRVGVTLVNAALQLDATADQRLDGAEGRLGLTSVALGYGDGRAAGASGTARFAWRKQALTADYRLAAAHIAAPQAALASLAANGTLRAQDNFARLELVGNVSGAGLRPGAGLDAALASAAQSATGSFAAPLLAQLRTALQREGRGSRFIASFIHRQTGNAGNLVVPQANLTGASGQTLLSLSRLQLSTSGSAAPLISGNFITAGPGIPRINGRMQRGPGGTVAMQLTMQDYAAGRSRLEIPHLMLVQADNGALGFAGSARLSGPLPGGAARNLALPLEGSWSASRGLAVWRKCAAIRFDSLTLASLTLQKRGLTLCPPPGVPILASDARGTRLAAGTSRLDLTGMLAGSPIHITGGAAGFAWPGSLAMRSVDVALGAPANPSRFRIASLAARLGQDVAGQFTGGYVSLAGVPLDVLDAGGNWRYADGRLSLADVAFRLEDRQQDARFQPLISQGAALVLASNRITAQAALRHPGSQREVVRAAIRHDLGSAVGSADLTMDGVLFDRQMQPDMLSRRLLGVLANVEGKVRGNGRIDWTPQSVTSTGRFTTDSLDFAAAFGPAKGLSGTVEFADLLGLVTAPDQHLKIASINPGIEVNDGELHFELRPGNVLAVLGAEWPFLDGTLRLDPVQMKFGVAETRRFALRITGLNAAKFVERMNLGNISATGIFDGVIPLVFDENGGQLNGGQLISRPPGGNVSYVGALSYKDLSTMANFAFEALKSLDYRRMQIDLNGPLEGEIITRVSFDGIAQGAGTKRNFLTKRIARLPIKFNVNLRAPFFKLVGSLRSLYDPSAVRDPRELGLVDANGKSLPSPPQPATSVQPSDSRKAPCCTTN